MSNVYVQTTSPGLWGLRPCCFLCLDRASPRPSLTVPSHHSNLSSKNLLREAFSDPVSRSHHHLHASAQLSLWPLFSHRLNCCVFVCLSPSSWGELPPASLRRDLVSLEDLTVSE